MQQSKGGTTKKSHNSKHKSKKSSKSGCSPVFEKEKSYKSFAGFTAKTIKCMWEQHEGSNETELSTEVLDKVAEDVTYKLWELTNNIKVFANKSSGRVTSDLVNVVLKDSNVDPIFGASSSFWDRIDSDGTYFFHFDEEIDLHDEYTKEVVVEELGPLHLSSGWFGEPNRQQELIEFYGNLIDGIYFGEKHLISIIFDIVSTNPHISLLCKLILNKVIEMLAFEYTDDVLERSLSLLNSLAFNPYTQSGQFAEELSYLSQIFEGLLLGAIKELKYEIGGSHFPVKMELQQIDEEALVSSFPAIQQVQEELIGNLKSEAEYPHFNEIKKECEDLFIMMNTNELESTLNKDQNDQGNVLLEDFYASNQHQQEPPDDESVKISEVSSEPEQQPKDVRAKMVTLNCNLRYLEDLCRTIGLCAHRWGHVEQELTYYLNKRLEEFFKLLTCWSDEEFEFIYRITQGLWALGEFAFREMCPYLEKIDTLTAPDFLINIFSRVGIFIHGRNDIFLYEWLQDLCGDTLLPFLIFYVNSVQKYNLKLKRRHDVIKASDASFKIFPKLNLVHIPKRVLPPQMQNSIFENFKPIIRSDKKKINFRFAGCRPVNLRGRKSKLIPTVVEPIIIQQPLDIFNSKVVIGKRKLLKPVTNIQPVGYLANYHLLVI